VSYLDESLTSGEVVLYRTRLHWSVLVWPVLVAVLFGVGAIALFSAAIGTRVQGRAGVFVFLGLLCGLVAAAAVAVGLIRRSSTEMAVTNRRVLMKTGIFARKTIELVLSKVESIGVEQGVMARLAGYGTVVVRGTGGTHELFERVARPLEFRRQVQEQINQIQSRSEG
jgi:uncharacterized membrane protein YdbT with pleckstrin-like domain